MKSEIGHTSLILFHGIGNPRKFGFLAAFLDAFDRYGSSQDPQTAGWPRAFRTKIEETPDGFARQLVQFRRVKRFQKRDVQVKIIRAYEGYWGDDIAKSVAPMKFLFWLLNIWVILIRMRFANWRSYSLHRLSSMAIAEDHLPAEKSAESLEALYRKFSTAPVVKEYPSGSFKEFLSFITEPQVVRTYGDLRDSAIKWRDIEKRRLTQGVIWIAFWVVIAAVASATTYWMILIFLSKAFVKLFVVSHLSHVVSIISFWLLVRALWLPVQRRISDVYYWSKLDERTEGFLIRERKIAAAGSLIWSVVSNKKCNDCVIVAHSLGTAIALEALNRVALKAAALDLDSNEVSERVSVIRKIKFVLFVGSPIDNIFSITQTNAGGSRRYSRVLEDNAISLSNKVFLDDTSAGALLVNFWSRFDPISSKIFSLRTPRNHPRKIIRNCESCPSGVPWPLSSHSGFFEDSRVMCAIYSAVMMGRIRSEELPRENLTFRHTRSIKILVALLAIILVTLCVASIMIWKGVLLIALILSGATIAMLFCLIGIEFNRQNLERY